MLPKITRLISCSLLLLIAACAPALSPTLIPTALPPTGTIPPPTATLPPPTPTISPPTPTAIPPEVIANLDAYFDKMGQQNLFSGAVLVARGDEVLLSEGYGLADRKQEIPNTPQTRFRIGSLTKQFTAMAILILESQGKLTVDDPICSYLADCPKAWASITIHHLLTHTSGIPNFTELLDYRSLRATPSTPLQTIARFRDLRLDFPPGMYWRYSDSGYVMLGYIIEQVSGQSYADFLQTFIFTPLQLRNTGYDHAASGIAVGYAEQYASLPAEFIDMSIPYAAGALYSTVEDLYRWEQALSTDELVPQIYLDKMFASQVVIPGSDGWAYGYGWAIGTEFGREVDMHTGGIEGFVSLIACYPVDAIVVVVLSNQESQDVDLIQTILFKKIFGDA